MMRVWRLYVCPSRLDRTSSEFVREKQNITITITEEKTELQTNAYVSRLTWLYRTVRETVYLCFRCSDQQDTGYCGPLALCRFQRYEARRARYLRWTQNTLLPVVKTTKHLTLYSICRLLTCHSSIASRAADYYIQLYFTNLVVTDRE